MRKPLPWGVWAIAGAKVAVLLGTVRFGFHRDELYFIAASKRLSWSYVDFQPVVPLLVRGERALLGDSLLGLRTIPALAGAALVVLAALVARELGGSRRAEVLASSTAAIVPIFLGMAGTLNTVALETPAWMLVAYVVARLLRTDDQRLWIALGAAVAFGLLVKFTVLAYLVGLAVAVVASPLRRRFLTPWPWLTGLIVAAALTPSILWQASHHWAVVEFVWHQGTGGRVLGLSGRAGFLASLAILPGPVALWVWVPGLRHLLRSATFRVLGVTLAVAFAVLLAASGKGYYAAPGIAVLLASGAVALDARPGWSPRVLAALLVVNVLPLLALGPALPLSVLRSNEALAQATETSERIGWEDMARTVGRVYGSLRPDEQRRAIVLGSNYTIPADIEFYSHRFHLPPAGSGHNSAYLWRPAARADRIAITVGFDEEDLRPLYRQARRVATIRNREGVHGYDWGDPVFVARGPKLSWDAEWRRLKDFTA